MNRPLPRLTAALSAVTFAATIVLGASAAPSADAAGTIVRYHSCGHVHTYVAVSERHTTCRKARDVARAADRHQAVPFGFRCHHVAVNAGAGYYIRCRHHAQRVIAIPE